LLYIAIKKLWQRKEIALIGFIGICFLAGYLYNQSSEFAALPMVCGLSWYYAQATKRMQKALLFFTFALFLFNFYQFLLLVWWCF